MENQNVGLAHDFEHRWYKHGDSLNDRNFQWTSYVWEQRDKGKSPSLKWRFLETNVSDFNPVTGLCRLCTREKYRILLEPSSATINRRTELFTPCRHKDAYIIGDPPD